MINKRTYKIWDVLLKSPNTWLSYQEIAKTTNMTMRQVSSLINTMPSPPIEKEKDKNKEFSISFARFVGDDEAVYRNRKSTLEYFYGIDDEMLDKICKILSPVGWMSVTDIASEIGENRLNVAKAMTLITDIDKKTTGSFTLYKLRSQDVRDDI